MGTFLLSFFLILTGFSPFGFYGYAATIEVTTTEDVIKNDGYCSLREAIINANKDDQSGSTDCPAGSGDDIIVLKANASYVLTKDTDSGGHVTDSGADNDDLDIASNITIQGNGATVERDQSLGCSGSSSSGEFRIFEVHSGATVTLKELKVKNGCAISGGSNDVIGAAILNYGSLTLVDSSFSDNKAYSGGAVFNGGILSISNNSFSGNTAHNGGGGAIHNEGTMDVVGCQFFKNYGEYGGAIENGGVLELKKSTLSENAVYLSGGAIYNKGSGFLFISDTTLSQNSADMNDGGAICSIGTLKVTNSTISGNHASGYGGGISFSGPTELNFVTITSNNAGYGDGIYIYTDSSVHIKNSIVEANDSPNCSGATSKITISGVNFDTDGTCVGFTQVSATQLKLGPLVDNGGPTKTHALLLGSVAIDAASDCTDIAGNKVIKDQRGVARPQGALCDAGAFEHPVYTLNVTPIPTEGTIESSPAGITCGSGGTQCAASFYGDSEVILTATPDYGYMLETWSGDCASCGNSSSCEINISSNKNCTAVFSLKSYTLTVTKGGTGNGTVTGCNLTWNGNIGTCKATHGTTITLSAFPDNISVFEGWSNGTGSATGCSGNDPCKLNLTADSSIKAGFALKQYTITVAATGNGSGTISSTPSFMAFNYPANSSGSASFDHGSTVTLTATAGPGSTVAWTNCSGTVSGNNTGTATCTFSSLESAKSGEAVFILNQYNLTVSKSGSGEGKVTSNPAGIDCGSDCEESYNHGTVVALTATASEGSTFAGWSGSCTGTGTCSVTIDQAKSVTATFNLKQYSISTSADPLSGGSVSCTPNPVNHGSTSTCTIKANAGYTLNTVTGTCGGTLSGNTYTTNAITSDCTVKANLSLNQYQVTAAASGNGSGSISSNPVGISFDYPAKNSGGASFSHGSTVTLTAKAGAGSTVAWTNCSGTVSGNNTDTATCTFTNLGDVKSARATFSLKTYTVTPSAGAGGTITPSTPQSVTHGSTLDVTATANNGYHVASLSGCGISYINASNEVSKYTATTAAITSNCTITATFANNTYGFSVTKTGNGAGTVTSSPSGISCGSDCTEIYSWGTKVTLTADPSSNSSFGGWSGDCSSCGTSKTCQVNVDATKSCSASFNDLSSSTFTLTVNKSGSSISSIKASGCTLTWSGNTGTCSAKGGTSITLTATPASGYSWNGWSDGTGSASGCKGVDPCTFVLKEDSSVTGTFSSAQPPGFPPELKVLKAGTGQSVITSTPPGIACGTECSQNYGIGTEVTLAVMTEPGSVFIGWSGDCYPCGKEKICKVTLNVNKACLAVTNARLRDGWNLLGLTGGNAKEISTLLGTNKDKISSMWKWVNEGEIPKWGVTLPNYGDSGKAYAEAKGFVLIDTLEPGKGFWVRANNVEEEEDIVLTGDEIGTPGAKLSVDKLSWHLVSLISGRDKSIEEIVQGKEDRILSIWKWDVDENNNLKWFVYLPGEEDKGKSYAESKGFGLIDTIRVGEGFWVNVKNLEPGEELTLDVNAENE